MAFNALLDVSLGRTVRIESRRRRRGWEIAHERHQKMVMMFSANSCATSRVVGHTFFPDDDVRRSVSDAEIYMATLVLAGKKS